MNESDPTQAVLEAKPKSKPKPGSAKAFIASLPPARITFTHLTGDCCKYGIHGMDEEAQEELANALAMKRPFDTNWFSDRKESYSWRIVRGDDLKLSLSASTSMDDPHDLTDTAVWVAFGKNKYAGSGVEALMKKFKLTIDQASAVIRALADASPLVTTAAKHHVLPSNDDSLQTVLNTLNELDALASGELEEEYNAQIAFVKRNVKDTVDSVLTINPEGKSVLQQYLDRAFGDGDDQDESLKSSAPQPLMEDVYKYSSTQLNLPSPLNDFVVKWGRMNVPDDNLWFDEKGGCGRETEPHITVLYGLLEREPSPALLDLIRRTKPFTVRLGKLSLFEQKDYDVLKFEVISDDLVELSNAIRVACPNENKYPKYQPHCTVAYCKKGTVSDLAGAYPFEASPPIPNEFEASEIVFGAAGDSENPERLRKVLPFNRYRTEAVDSGSFKDFLLGKGAWSYQIEVDEDHKVPPHYRGNNGYHAFFQYNGVDADGATNTYDDADPEVAKAKAAKQAEAYIKRFKRLERTLKFVPGKYPSLWRWYEQALGNEKYKYRGESTATDVKKAAAQAAEEPTDAQKEAGNYAKGHVTLHGLDIAIENAKGTTRSGKGKDGKEWSVTMPSHYGYVKGTKGKDKDHIDVYVGPDPESEKVWVVDQQNKEGGFDEHKVMLGFKDRESVLATYDKAFTGDLGPQLRGAVTSTTLDALKAWFKDGDTTKPFKKHLADAVLAGSAKDYLKTVGRNWVVWVQDTGGVNYYLCTEEREEGTVWWFTLETLMADRYQTREEAQSVLDRLFPEDKEGQPAAKVIRLGQEDQQQEAKEFIRSQRPGFLFVRPMKFSELPPKMNFRMAKREHLQKVVPYGWQSPGVANAIDYRLREIFIVPLDAPVFPEDWSTEQIEAHMAQIEAAEQERTASARAEQARMDAELEDELETAPLEPVRESDPFRTCTTLRF